MNRGWADACDKVAEFEFADDAAVTWYAPRIERTGHRFETVWDGHRNPGVKDIQVRVEALPDAPRFRVVIYTEGADRKLALRIQAVLWELQHVHVLLAGVLA